MIPEPLTIFQVREQLAALLRRVPASVNGGSHQIVLAYKQAAVTAQKAFNSPRSKLEVLKRCVAELRKFEE